MSRRIGLSRSFTRPGGRRSTPAMPESQESTQQLSPKIRPGIPVSDQLDPLSCLAVDHELSSLELPKFSVGRDVSPLNESVKECADGTQEGNIVWTDMESQSQADRISAKGIGEVPSLLLENSGEQLASSATFQPFQAMDSGDREGSTKNSIITPSAAIEFQERPISKIVPVGLSPQAIELDQSRGFDVVPDIQHDVAPADGIPLSFIPSGDLSESSQLRSNKMPVPLGNEANLQEGKRLFISEERRPKIFTSESSQSISPRRLESTSFFHADEPRVRQTMSPVSKHASAKGLSGLENPSRSQSKSHAQASDEPLASRRGNRTKEPNISEESFAIDSIPIKHPEPLDVIANLLRQHSEEMKGEAKKLKNGKKGPTSKFELSEKQGDELFGRHEKARVEMSGEKEFEVLQLAAGVSPNRGRTTTVGHDGGPGSSSSQRTNVTFHSSPHTVPLEQSEPSVNVQRQINHIIDQKDGAASQSCHLLRSSPSEKCRDEPFRSFAEQGYLFDENRLSTFDEDLFSSSQVVDGGLDVSEDAFSQRSNIFQATQVVRLPSGPLYEADLSSSAAITSPRGLAPTQRSSSDSPENSQTLRTTVTDSIPLHSSSISASVPTSKPPLPTIPSIPPHRSLAYNSRRFIIHVSAEDNARFDIPRDRQLQRREVNRTQLNDRLMEPLPLASETTSSPAGLCEETIPAYSDIDTARPMQSPQMGRCSPNKSSRSQEIEEVDGHEPPATVESDVQATGDDQPTINDVTHNLRSSRINRHSPFSSLPRSHLSSKAGLPLLSNNRISAFNTSNDLLASKHDTRDDPSNPFLTTHEMAARPYERRVRKKPEIFSPATCSADRLEVTSRKSPFKGDGIDEESDISSAPEDADDFSYRPAVKTARVSRINGRLGGRTCTSIDSAFSEAKQMRVPSTSPLSTLTDRSLTPDDENDVTSRPLKRQKLHSTETKGVKTRTTAATQTNSNLSSKKKARHVIRKSRAATPHIVQDVNRVLARYGHYYYPARIVEPSRLGYKVIYDDDDDGECAPDKLRKLILKRGDKLEAYERHDLPTKMEVLSDWDGNERGVKCVSNGKILGYVELRFIRIRQQIIKQQFNDRLFVPQLAAKSPTRSTLRSPVKNFGPAVFEGMIVLILTGVEENSVEYEAKSLSKLIEIRGGMVAKDWTQIFEPDLHRGHFKSNLGRTPFVIPTGTRPLMTSTFMVALAKGIPVLSVKYVDAAIEEGKVIDWHPYLISSGYSYFTRQMMSQVVDTSWGTENWDPVKAGHLLKPFKGKKVLFIQPRNSLSSLLTLCSTCLGAEEVRVVERVSGKDLDAILDPKWDYLVIDKMGVPNALKECRKVANVQWLKQCLVMGKALPPLLASQDELEKEVCKIKKEKSNKGNARKRANQST
ncbi:hypothetical protein J008_02648 [Cryptococcus neoformans]|nr:hypothetical protein J008_02648 [Cryptococcus neoformans var. grubii]